jgi:hypothetical protein
MFTAYKYRFLEWTRPHHCAVRVKMGTARISHSVERENQCEPHELLQTGENIWSWERVSDRRLQSMRNEKLHNLHCSLNIIKGDQTKQEGMARLLDTQRTTVVHTLVANRQLQKSRRKFVIILWRIDPLLSTDLVKSGCC